MTIRRNLMLQPVLVLLGVALQGCSSTPRFNEHFGSAVRANLSAQVINPAAAVDANPASAARAAQERYQRSFKETESGADRSLINVSAGK
jgi:type IV pilus biogenesis protein CpaD/CtpE